MPFSHTQLREMYDPESRWQVAIDPDKIAGRLSDTRETHSVPRSDSTALETLLALAGFDYCNRPLPPDRHLPPEVVNQHAERIVRFLDYVAPSWEYIDGEGGYETIDDKGAYRLAALAALAVSSEAVANHLEMITLRLCDSKEAVRTAAKAVLAKWPDTVVQQQEEIAQRLVERPYVERTGGLTGRDVARKAALRALATSPAAAAQQHEAVARCLSDAMAEHADETCEEALELLAMSAEAVTQHHEAIAQSLQLARIAALRALGVSAEAVAQHHEAIAQCLQTSGSRSNAEMLLAALNALGTSAEAVAQHHEAVTLMLCECGNVHNVPRRAAALLGGTREAVTAAVVRHRAALERLRVAPTTETYQRLRVVNLLNDYTSSTAAPAPAPPAASWRQLHVAPRPGPHAHAAEGVPTTPTLREEHEWNVAAERAAAALRERRTAGAAGVGAAGGEAGEVEEVELYRIGWMALKKLVVARGVPRADVNAVTSQAALRQLAEAHGAPLRFVVGR